MPVNASQSTYARTATDFMENVLRDLGAEKLTARLNEQSRARQVEQPASSRPEVVETGRYTPLPGRRQAQHISVVVSRAAPSNPLGYSRMPKVKGDVSPGQAWSEKFPYQFSVNGVSYLQTGLTVQALGGSLELQINGAGRSIIAVPARDGGEPIKVYDQGVGVMAYPPALAAQLTMADIRGRLKAAPMLSFNQGAAETAAAYGYPLALVKGGELDIKG